MSPTAFDSRVQTFRRRRGKLPSPPVRVTGSSLSVAVTAGGARQSSNAVEGIDLGSRGRATVTLVAIGPEGRKNRLLSEFLFLLITVGPWVLMTWLLWPRS